MAVAFDAATTNNANMQAANGSTSFTHAGGSGSNTIAFVIVLRSFHSGGTVTLGTVSYGGTNMTSMGAEVSTTSATAAAYYLIAPAAGSQTVIVNWVTSNVNDPLMTIVLTYTGADQTTGFHNYNTANNPSSTNPTVAITSATGELVVDAAGKEDNGTITHGGDNERANTTYTFNGDPMRFAAQETAGAATVNTSWTSAIASWIDLGWSILPAATAAQNQLWLVKA